MSDDVPKVVRAERFELVDGSGETRALLDATPDGDVAFNMFDENDNLRVMISSHHGGAASVHLQGENGEERIGIMAGSSGQVINIKDGQGRPRLQLQLDNQETGTILLPDAEGQQRIAIGTLGEHEDAPVIYLRDSQGEDKLQLQVGPGEMSILGMKDESGEYKVILGVDGNGDSHLSYETLDGERDRIF